MVTSIGGISSGMDTTSLINSLMQLASRPQTNLKTKVSSYTTNNSAYQTVNTKMKALLTASQDLTKTDTWKAAKATSSSTDVVATASTGAQIGDLAFTVTSLASAQRTTARFDTGESIATMNGTIQLTIGDQTLDPITLADGQDTPQGVADAINQAGLAVRASVVTTDTGSFLQLSSTKTGTANAFSISGLNTTTTDIGTAANAVLTVGDPENGGFEVTSSSNTFTGVMPGVTITASKAPVDATVTVNTDNESLATKMQALVDAANSALAQIGLSAASGSGTASSAGPLAGDYTVRQLSSKVLSAVSSGFPGSSFKQMGVQLTQDGKLKFNKDDFLKSYAENPAGTQQAISTGLAKTLEDIADSATDTVSGSLTQKIQSGTTMISRLTREIQDWDSKLADRRTALQRQFTAMETALGKISSQSSWLSSQTAASNSDS